jgi:hypothetical protein
MGPHKMFVYVRVGLGLIPWERKWKNHQKSMWPDTGG